MKYQKPNRTVSYYEMTNYPAADIMKAKKLDGRQFEQQVRHECADAKPDEMKAFMQNSVYNNKQKRN